MKSYEILQTSCGKCKIGYAVLTLSDILLGNIRLEAKENKIFLVTTFITKTSVAI